MIELGKYATTVLSAYGVSAVLLAVLVLLTMRSNSRSKRRLAELQVDKNG